jgi:hypothetical protein
MRAHSTGPSKTDTFEMHKAVLVKIPVGGTNLGSSEWNYYFPTHHLEILSFVLGN